YFIHNYLDANVQCRIWIEDSQQNRIAGDEFYHDCSNYRKFESIDLQKDQTYWVHAKVEGSFEKPKVRGPYNENTCFDMGGDVDDWHFDQRTKNCT
ncbi:6472_t:CDS:1, partial [Gigaspora margarita]